MIQTEKAGKLDAVTQKKADSIMHNLKAKLTKLGSNIPVKGEKVRTITRT